MKFFTLLNSISNCIIRNALISKNMLKHNAVKNIFSALLYIIKKKTRVNSTLNQVSHTNIESGSVERINDHASESKKNQEKS